MSEATLVHFPGIDGAETLAWLRAGMLTRNILGLEREPAIAAQTLQNLNRDPFYRALREQGQPDITILPVELRDAFQAIGRMPFDIYSLDYTGTFTMDAMAAIDWLQRFQTRDRWILHVAHLGKRDPDSLKAMTWMFHMASDARNMYLPTATYYKLQKNRMDSWDKLSREDRTAGLFEFHRTVLTPRYLERDAFAPLRHLSNSDGTWFDGWAVTKGYQERPLHRSKRWGKLKPRLVARHTGKDPIPEVAALFGSMGLMSGRVQAALGEHAPRAVAEYAVAAIAGFELPVGFVIPWATRYTYTSDTAAPMIGFVADVARGDQSYGERLDRFASRLGFPGNKFRVPVDEAFREFADELYESDPGIVRSRAELDFVDLGGQGRPRLTRKRAIDAFIEGASIADLENTYHIPKSLVASLPAIKAHVTMGTYDPKTSPAADIPGAHADSEGVLRTEAFEFIDAGFSTAEVADALDLKVGTVRAWLAHRTMGTYDSRAD